MRSLYNTDANLYATMRVKGKVALIICNITATLEYFYLG